MIPKIIHFCWFGGNPLPELAQKCIASWRKYLPEYEIWQWSENLNGNVKVNETLRYENETVQAPTKTKDNSIDTELLKEQEISQIEPNLSNKINNFEPAQRLNSLNCTIGALEPAERLEPSITRVMEFDVNCIPYTAEAYRQGKYAFVSDYARFWILYKYGGIYFDTDVEVIRPLDEIIAQGNFMGFELNPDGENDPQKYAPRYAFAVNPGVGMGFEKEHPFLKVMLDKYATLEYETPVFPWGKTIVAYTTEELCKRGLRNVQGVQEVDGVNIYPSEYFSPIDIITNRLHVTEKTVSIHRFTGTWGDKRHRSWKDLIRCYIPEWVFYLNNKIKRRRYKIK